MKKQKAITKLGLKVALAYRFDFLISLILTPISLVIFYFLWKTIFEYSGESVIKGFTFQAMISYYVLNMIVAFFTSYSPERWMEKHIIHGHFIFELLKPISIFSNYYFFHLGLNLLSIVIEAIPIFIIGFLFFDLILASPLNILFFVISIILASFIFFLLSYLLGLSSFWFKRITGLSRAKKPIIAFLGGGLIPLTFFPVGVRAVLEFLPFQYVRFVPISIYLGRYTLYETLFYLGIQLVWIVALYFLAKIVWKRAFKKFAGVGV